MNVSGVGSGGFSASSASGLRDVRACLEGIGDSNEPAEWERVCLIGVAGREETRLNRSSSGGPGRGGSGMGLLDRDVGREISVSEPESEDE
jgi:hypothetical protein